MRKKSSSKVTPLRQTRKKGWNPKKLFFSIGVVVFVFFLLLFGLYSYQLQNLAQEKEENQEKLEEHRGEKEELQEQVELWKDEDFLKLKAREKLGLIKPEETVIILED